jgi:hypothetical protein
MTEYIFEYKCRRCGGIVAGAVTTNKSVAFATLVEVELTEFSSYTAGMVKKTTVHSCDDGGSGIADLLGYSPRGDNAS